MPISTADQMAMPTDDQMKQFIESMNFQIKVEKHTGPKRTSYNIVLYFEPFKGRYLNYMRRWVAKYTKALIADKNNMARYRGRQKGPGGRGIYIGLKYRPPGHDRLYNYYKKHNISGDHWNWRRAIRLDRNGMHIYSTIIGDRYREHWKFHGRTKRMYERYDNKNNDGKIYHVNIRTGIKQDAIHCYEWMYPLTYEEAQRGYKVLQQNCLPFDSNGILDTNRYAGLIGCIMFNDWYRLSNNYLYGKYLHDKINQQPWID